MPVRLAGDGHIYRRLRDGNLLELSMLDLRTYRSEQASGAAVDDPARTIAGAAQLVWLTDPQGVRAVLSVLIAVGTAPAAISRLHHKDR